MSPALKEIVDRLSLDDLKELNRAAVARINAIEGSVPGLATARDRFKVGDLVEFLDRAGRKIRITVDRVNPKTLGGHQIDGAKGRWRVSPSLCRLVGSDEPALPAAKVTKEVDMSDDKAVESLFKPGGTALPPIESTSAWPGVKPASAHVPTAEGAGSW